MSKLTYQTFEPLISGLKKDTKQYGRRKIILTEQQELIAIGQLNFIISPIQCGDNRFHFNMLMPRQLMTLTVQKSG
jgi:hypothetical protein